MSSTVSTRFLVISDTHDFEFGDAERHEGEFTYPAPKCDVLLHCGDLTMSGGIPAYERCVKMLGKIDAELKLIIAGNHDLDLDDEYDPKGNSSWDAPDLYKKAIEVWRGPLVKQAGITYLEEGLNTFTLKNGAKFTIYTSPYQPEFYNWAFPYERNEDRFNPPDKVSPGVTSIVQNPVPDFPGVDIMMTHGPPKDTLDWTAHGRVGCQALATAVSRARPLMYCFGHIHEAYGMELVTWKEDKNVMGPEAIQKKDKKEEVYPNVMKVDVKPGSETLMVNASIMSVRYRPKNAPWLVDLELPKATEVALGSMM
ncbi:Metallo-dependent phosphatase [Venustampulla echinocandica]|uniref:Metallo-dependent phosphatase n=1 Tax=Venustampulla echinocandica TaxID=2656787 RepID=A0A370TCN0_9HELO|nr:Metallo-dependent phosphatase [Venustampulla echinocandica]RDL32013.1 Metallo-dependent phosphatase [Venustampulla echinocandica]